MAASSTTNVVWMEDFIVNFMTQFGVKTRVRNNLKRVIRIGLPLAYFVFEIREAAKATPGEARGELFVPDLCEWYAPG
jgi:hypothetical protein